MLKKHVDLISHILTKITQNVKKLVTCIVHVMHKRTEESMVVVASYLVYTISGFQGSVNVNLCLCNIDKE